MASTTTTTQAVFVAGESTFLRRQRGARATRAAAPADVLGVFTPVRVEPTAARKMPAGSALWFTERDSDGNDVRVGFDIQGTPLHSFNHSCEPNCHVRHDSNGRVAVVALRPICAGDELVFDYLAGDDSFFRKLWFKCRCSLCERRAMQVRGAAVAMMSTPPAVLFAALCPRLAGSVVALVLSATLIFLRRRSGQPHGLAGASADKDSVGTARTTVFKPDREGRVFRIPALLRLPPCHAEGEVLIAFAERRASVRDWGQIDVVCRRSTDGGHSWSDVAVVLRPSDLDFEEREKGARLMCASEKAGLTIGNPCPAWDDEAREVVLLLTVSCGSDNEAAILSRCAHDTRRVFLATSATRGRSWSRAQEVTSRAKRNGWTWYATGPGGAVQLRAGAHAGRLVFPCNHAHSTDEGYVRRAAHVLLADRGEGGALQLRIGGCGPAHSNEPAVAEAADGALLLNARDMSGRCVRWACRSSDGGESWVEEPRSAELVEPQMHGCHATLVRCRGWRSRLAFANPASERRERLTVRWSDDDGRTWPAALVVHAGPAAYCSAVPLPATGEAGPDVDGTVGGVPPGEGALALLFECGEASPYERVDFAVVHSASEPDRCKGGSTLSCREGLRGGADGMHGAWG